MKTTQLNYQGQNDSECFYRYFVNIFGHVKKM